MRIRITLSDELIGEVDRRVGVTGRSSFIDHALRQALDAHRWELIESSLGAISSTGHDWDADPASWVREQRRADAGRAG